MIDQNGSYRSELRDFTAETVLEEAVAFGVLLEYQDRGTDCFIKVWGIPGEQKRVLVQVGKIIEEQTTRDFTIPRQLNCICGAPNCFLGGIDNFHQSNLLFPPPMFKPPGTNNPSTYSIIVFDDWEWSVDSWVSDSVDAVFTLSSTRHQPRRIAD